MIVEMHLRQATDKDYYLFKIKGYMYFLWSHLEQKMDSRPYYMSDETDKRELLDAITLGYVYVPMNFFEINYKINNHEIPNQHRS